MLLKVVFFSLSVWKILLEIVHFVLSQFYSVLNLLKSKIKLRPIFKNLKRKQKTACCSFYYFMVLVLYYYCIREQFSINLQVLFDFSSKFIESDNIYTTKFSIKHIYIQAYTEHPFSGMPKQCSHRPGLKTTF